MSENDFRPDESDSTDQAGPGAAAPGDQGSDPAPVGADDAELATLLETWLPEQRWFAGKGRERGAVVVTDRIPVATVRDGAAIELVLVELVVAGTLQRYQLWLGWHPWPPQSLDHARIGSAGNWTAYDALGDGEVATLLLSLIAAGAHIGALSFETEPDADIDTTPPGRPIGVEQSNSSLVYGHSSILKLFRRLEPGPNPDAEVHRALHAIGGRHVATPLGTLSFPVAGQPTTLGLLTTYFAGSAEGWAMATNSVRDLMAEGDLRADEVGGDFAAESHRLGRAVAEVHLDLARAFGTREFDETAQQDLVATMIAATEQTASFVPEIAEQLDAIRTALSRAVESAGAVPAQRIHGDLHLGQVLRVPDGWALLDFEGEPSKPLSYRRALHSPLRDVAGMLRSFDYAAHHSLVGRSTDSQHQYRATEWAARNCAAFCSGYAEVAGYDPRQHDDLLIALQLEKAIYEVAYESGHRPAWTPIPLHAVSRLVQQSGGSS